MGTISNQGTDRVVDVIQTGLADAAALDLATAKISVFAFEQLRDGLRRLSHSRLVLPTSVAELELLGSAADRRLRNQLRTRWLAVQLADWLSVGVEIRAAEGGVPHGWLLLRNQGGTPTQVLTGSFALDTRGLGLAPGQPWQLIQTADDEAARDHIGALFEQMWTAAPNDPVFGQELISELRGIAAPRSAESVYSLMLHHLLSGDDGELDEDKIVNAATGIRDTAVWNKLYKFQRDGVIAAIDKLNRFGGCIIADSVGLGKTFEALAVIKYHELRNDRVLVLCPKRLRDNWTLYAANDDRNLLAADRFNYDVLNHTDLSRDGGYSGDIDLSHVNWGNYDLVVIDESHNFRNDNTPRQGGETRYGRLMRRIIKEGVNTRVLMLSATPVNNRLADLRNQIVLATAGDPTALAGHGIASIDATTQRAQKEFNRWNNLAEERRTTAELVQMLGYDYFKLLDLLTIARSRRHIEKYYDTSDIGSFPERLKPLNFHPDIDNRGEFPPIGELAKEIQRLSLAIYSPMLYILPGKAADYEAKYATTLRSGEVFNHSDRERSLVRLMRSLLLKRLESSAHAFSLTVRRMVDDIDTMIERIDAHQPMEDIAIGDIEFDDPDADSLLVGKKVKVLLQDLDLIRLRQDLDEDQGRLRLMLDQAIGVTPDRDAKLDRLRRVIEEKCASPINPGNRKIIVFTASTDTARYLYEQLAPWAKQRFGLESGLVSGGSGGNRSTIKELRADMASILSAFSPRSKQRPDTFSGEGQIDLLIATDCISEGQNLQDCDWLVNYDIHWNPVRIIQRFGRIDRLGSINERIQLVNFWPNMELDEYIGLVGTVKGRMKLLDVSATGEENVIEWRDGSMNDLKYRRDQLLRMQDAVVDLEELSEGISITDMALTDFRIDLAEYHKTHPGELDATPPGASAVVTTSATGTPPGTVFCIRAEGAAAREAIDPGYPLAPHYLIHVGTEGTVLLGHPQARQIMESLKRLSAGRTTVDFGAYARHDQATRHGRDMGAARAQLDEAVASITGRRQERVVESLFTSGGTLASKGVVSKDDFEVLAYMIILPEKEAL